MSIFEYILQFFSHISADPFTQGSGFIAMIIILIAYVQKDDFTVKKLMLLASLFWGIHFYLLGVYAGLVATVIWVIRLLLSVKFERSFKAFLSIVIITLISGYFTFDGFFSLIPIVTSILWAYSYFYLEKIKLRLAFILNSSLWMIYHISIGSVSGVTNEIFTQTVLIATIYRMLHPEGGTRYYAQKIKDILWKKSRPDYDRFIFIHDKIVQFRNRTWTLFLQILHLDLKKSFLQKKWLLCEKYVASKKDALVSE